MSMTSTVKQQEKAQLRYVLIRDCEQRQQRGEDLPDEDDILYQLEYLLNLPVPVGSGGSAPVFRLNEFIFNRGSISLK